MDSSAALNELRKRSADPDRKLLLRGVTVLSMDAEVGDLEEADVLVEGRRIAAIAPRLEVGDEDVLVLELPGHVAIPGLQDTHRHCWQTQLRRMFVDIDGLEGYVDKVHRKIAPCYTPDDMRLGSLLAGLGALDAGITSILDFSHNSRSKAHSDGAIEGWVESGIRAVHASCGPVLGDWEGQWPGDLERLQERHFSSEDQLVTLRMGLLTPQIPGVGEHLEVTREHLEIGRGLGLKITVDAVFGEMAAGRLRELGREDLLGPDMTYIHCQDLDDDAWSHIVGSGGSVALCPTSDAYVGQRSSITPIQKVIDLGLRPGLSSDVECTNGTDLFAQMQAALTIQRMLSWNARFNGDEGAPDPIPARDLLTFATIAGAAANGLDHKVGSLTPGKEADIVLIDAEAAGSMPLNNAVGTVVMGANPGNVAAVFVAGEARKWDGKLVGVDIDAVRREAVASRDRLVAESGVPLEVVG